MDASSLECLDIFGIYAVLPDLLPIKRICPMMSLSKMAIRITPPVRTAFIPDFHKTAHGRFPTEKGIPA